MFDLARAAERTTRFADAVALCSQVVELAPDGARAATCRGRIEHLEARRDADGTWTSFGRLEAVRRRWQTDDREALAREVEALAVQRGPPLVVRAEVAVWLANDALQRRGDPAAALSALEAGPRADELPASEEALAQVWTRLQASALAGQGRAAEARAAEGEARVAAGAHDTPVDRLLRDQRRAWGAAASGWVLAACALVGLPLAASGWSSRPRPMPAGLLPLVIAGLGAALLAWARGEGGVAAALGLLLGAAGVHLVSLGALIRVRQRPWPRRAVRVLAILATLAVSYVALWSAEALDVIGL